ncbi:50S ribosomal protein L25 [Neorickettsia sennetsu]|uniref:Large ribosomal subunit protein bL25 n=1 Tax=Ehrlichia sennetsu (strain ATCC VR-367 / Miyayama) TaxID=222891 RepID=RL25_EHRS3|nr:50S ribosomal protein L25 [Neorickettsia sennetsu]Q2GEA0.1 RecName: Full=Large ribosomal subunit protein bL25; AltName: Full=50S ribosomal protein L25; AltName: Full=General stress protein CTC [Neorickettsia sennetsu str. Miyayama]ABD46173.1 ribosomal 5S rRNA E-loop binding protein Ctc/L25/TL5 [Neorickettsia sennetsu str. Miyayama]
MVVSIECIPRTSFGRNSANVLRRSGFVPAVIYGKERENINVAISVRDVSKHFAVLSGSGVVELSCEGKVYKVVPKAYELHPVSSVVLHLDFVFAGEHASKFQVPLNFVNSGKSEAIRLGAMLNIVKRTVLVRCTAANLPKSIPVDIENAKVGDSIKFSDLVFPDGVVPLARDANSVVATVVGKKVKAGTVAATA